MMINGQRKSTYFKLTLIAAASVCALFFGKECSGGALRGIYFCAEVLVPSLFPFMVISTFTVKSGISRAVGKRLSRPTRAVFGVSGSCAPAILLSVIGGYPVGARSLRALYDSGEISRSDAEKCSYTAIAAGPGFLITFVGIHLLGSAETGWCIFAAQVISVFLLGLLNKFVIRDKTNFNSEKEYKASNTQLSTAVVESTIKGTYATLEMCGMVILFSAFYGVVSHLLAKSIILKTGASILLEVTGACNLLSEEKNVALIAFAVGFGGLCVHFQVFQALEGLKIKYGLFFLYRIMQGILTAGLAYLFVRIWGVTVPVFSSVSEAPRLTLSSSLLGSALLLLSGICFIYNLKKR